MKGFTIILAVVYYHGYVASTHNQYECPDANWRDNGQYCYLYQMSEVAFSDAETQCNQLGSQLTSIHSLEQHFEITRIAEEVNKEANVALADFWIGLKDVVTSPSASAVWTDGSEFDYERWDNTEPDGGSQCTYINDNDGHWYDRTCTNEYNSMCQYTKECGGVITSNTTIAVGGLYNYSHNAHCTWYLQHPNLWSVSVNVQITGINCDMDYLQIFGGDYKDSPPVGPKLCSNNVSLSVTYTPGSSEATVVFVTDGSGTAEGFTINVYFSESDLVCYSAIKSSTYMAATSISSDGFSSLGYSPNTQCVWEIEDDNNQGTISINFLEIALENPDTCIHDYIRVIQGSNDNGDLVGVYCHADNPPRIILPASSIHMIFIADEENEGKGFEFELTFHSCGGQLTSPGSITSPSFGMNYGNDQSCGWQIAAPSDQQIKLAFSANFGISGTIPCHNEATDDYLEIFDGPHPTSRSIGKFCGTETPPDMTSQTNQMLLVFYSNSQTRDIGFSTMFSFISSGTAPCKSSSQRDSAIVTLPMDDVSTSGVIEDGTYSISTLKGTVNLVSGVLGKALYIDESVVYSLGTKQQSCFFDPNECLTGSTLSVWIYYVKEEADSYEMLQVLSSGGQASGSFGWSIFLDPASNGNGLLIDISNTSSLVTLMDFSWSKYAAEKVNKWTHLVISVDSEGASLYENGDFVRYSMFQPREQTSSTDNYTDYTIGLPNNQLNASYFQGKAYIDDLLFWDSPKNSEFVSLLYESYEARREICVEPFICVDGECVCPDSVFDCGITITFTSSINSGETVAEDTVTAFTCSIQIDKPFQLALALSNGTQLFTAGENETSFQYNSTISRSHNGVEFVCLALSVNGNIQESVPSSDSFVYNVKYQADDLAIGSGISPSLEVTEFTTIKLTCTTAANPVPYLSIVFRNKTGNIEEIASSESPTLLYETQFIITSRFHERALFCLATALDDSYTIESVNTVTFAVIYPARVVIFSSSTPSNTTLSENSRISLVCVSLSNPQPQLSIVFNDRGNVQEMSSDNSQRLFLTINLTRIHNGAEIYCTSIGNSPSFSVESNRFTYTIQYTPAVVLLTSSIATDAVIPEDTQVTFTCEADSNPVASLSLIEISQTERVIAQQNKNSWTISVFLTKEQNGSTFMCRANGSDPQFSLDSIAQFIYNVEYPARDVTLTSSIRSNTTLLENTEVTLECVSDSNPQPQLSIVFTDGGNVQEMAASNGPSLLLTVNLTRIDNGADIYCTSTGNSPSFSIESSRYSYTIKYTPAEVLLTSSIATDAVVPEDTQVIFTCEADSNPVASLSLIEISQTEQVIAQQIGNSWTISVFLTKEQNGSTFMCRANGRNPQFSLDSIAQFTYNVEYVARTVTLTSSIASNTTLLENTEVTLECVSDSNPQPQLSIVFNGGGHVQEMASINGSSLLLAVNLTRTYNGAIIYCEATGIGEAFSLTSLNYIYTIQYTPLDVILESSIATNTSVSEGTQVTFTCSSDSNPIGTLSLVTVSDTEQQEIARQKTSIWTISVVLTKEHNGRIFMCRANGVDPVFSVNSSSHYEYNVGFSSSDLKIEISPSDNVLSGTEVTISCRTGVTNPVLDISWTQNDTDIPNTISTPVQSDNNALYASSQLTVTADVAMDNTIFACHAGTLTSSVTLFVIAIQTIGPPTESVTEAIVTDNGNKIVFGILGGIVGVGVVIAITVTALYFTTKSASGVAKLKLNALNRNYITRGIRGKVGY